MLRLSSKLCTNTLKYYELERLDDIIFYFSFLFFIFVIFSINAYKDMFIWTSKANLPVYDMTKWPETNDTVYNYIYSCLPLCFHIMKIEGKREDISIWVIN